MISFIVYAIQKSLTYVKNHPQIVLVLSLLIIMPLLFLYSGQQFLEAGRSNQDRLQKDRVGLMHDVFASLIVATNYNPEIIQNELQKIAAQNPDIKDFKVTKREGKDIVPIAALNPEDIQVAEESAQFYKDSAIRIDESMIFEFYNQNDAREWFTYRAIETGDGELYFIFTQMSLESVDKLFSARERTAMYSLVIVYVFIIALAFWHVRLTDYKFLYAQVQKANEMKDLFTNMIAHELRAPLTAIRGYASLIKEDPTSNNIAEDSARIEESAERLLTIVNDLLDVARIQSGKLSVETAESDISTIVVSVLDELKVSGAEKNIVLSHTGTNEAHIVLVDEKRMHQALTNLVSNAIKYTKEGSIELSLEEKRSVVELRVKDTGMGISSEDQQNLFAPFFRVATTDVSKITGTGLGMWITKQLIELMGAKIGVESIKGVGTHVVVTLQKPKK